MSNEKLPDKFPFWARLKIDKKRTTLVIDEGEAFDKKTQKKVPGYIHREATHTEKKDYEKLDPNPDKTDKRPMYLKRPKATPKKLFKPHNKKLEMPKSLIDRYKK